MNRLKGVLKLYSKDDLLPMVCVLSGVAGVAIYNFTKAYDGEFFSQIKGFLNVLSYFISIDYVVSFSSRYLMYSNFSNCRKSFYKSQVILILLKSISLTFVLNLLIIMEIIFCKIKNYNYVIIVLGIRIHNIHGIELVKLMILIFIAITLFWSTSFVFSSMEQLVFAVIIVMLLSLWMLIYMLFGSSGVFQSYSYVQVIVLGALLTLINFIVAWFIIKKKSQLGDSWFIKTSKSLYRNDANE